MLIVSLYLIENRKKNCYCVSHSWVVVVFIVLKHCAALFFIYLFSVIWHAAFIQYFSFCPPCFMKAHQLKNVWPHPCNELMHKVELTVV